MPGKIKVCLLFFCLPVLFAPAVFAGIPGESLDRVLEMSLRELMDADVVTASKTVQKISAAPTTAIVVTREQIRERGYVNLPDLLDDLPGVLVNRKSISGQYNRVTIRGNAENNKFLILQNGFRIHSPTGERSAPIDNNFPLFHAKRVEVIYGPTSALYGADAVTGVINIITEEGRNIDGAEIASSLGTDDYFYESVNVGKRLADRVDLAFGGHWHGSQNPDLAEAYPDRYRQQDLLTAAGKVFQTAEERGPLTFFGETASYSAYLEMNVDDRFNVGYRRAYFSHPTTVNVRPENTLFAKDAVWNTLDETLHGKYRREFGANLTGETLVDYSRFEILPATKFTNNFADFGAFKYGEGGKVKLEQQLNYRPGETHDFVGGLIFEHNEAIPSTADLPDRYDTDRGVNEQNLFYPGTGGALRIKIFEEKYENYGVYFQAQSRWLERFSTSLGARLDYDSRFGSTFNPRLGAIAHPGGDTLVKLLYGESFLAPSPERAFQNFGSFDGTRDADGKFVSAFFFVPNTGLKPEKSRTLELSVTHDATPSLVLTVTGFYTRVNDIITNVNKNQTSDFIEGGSILSIATNENSGIETIFGGEFRADHQARLGAFDFKSWFAYSWLDGKIDNPGGGTSPLPLTAHNSVKAGTTMVYAGKYYLTPRLIWVDKTDLFAVRNGAKAPAYAVAHLHAGADGFYGRWSAAVTVQNLLDVRYFNAGSTFETFAASPQDPRRVIFTLGYKF
jgi:iron complex outermembrane receptor protein